MPKTTVILYCEEDGSCPFLEWLGALPVKAKDKCLVRLERLGELGHDLRRIRRSIAMGRRHDQKPGTATDAVEIIYRRIYKGKPDRIKGLEEVRANDEIARKIFGLRAQAGLTQAQLGKLIGTTASVICRLEDADYEGHSLAMLRRIAAALNQRVEIRFVPTRRTA